MVRTAPARHDCSRPSADCSRPSALCGRRDEQGIVYLVFTPAAPRGSDVDALFRSYSADYRAAHRLDLSLVSGLVVGVTVVALADRLRATSRRAVSWAAILRGGRRHWTPRWLATFCAAGLAALGPRPRPPSSHARVGELGSRWGGWQWPRCSGRPRSRRTPLRPQSDAATPPRSVARVSLAGAPARKVGGAPPASTGSRVESNA